MKTSTQFLIVLMIASSCTSRAGIFGRKRKQEVSATPATSTAYVSGNPDKQVPVHVTVINNFGTRQ